MLFDERIVDDFGERGHRANLDAVARAANSFEFFDAAKIHQNFRALDAVLEPIEAIESSSHDPSIGSVLLQKFLRVADGAGLKQIESRHDVSYYGHGCLPLQLQRNQMCATSGCCIGRPASNDVRMVSAFTGAR